MQIKTNYKGMDIAEKRKSICMISDDFLPSATGVGAHLKVVATELIKRGHKVSIITTKRPGEPNYEIWQGVEVYRTFTLKVGGFYQALPSITTIEEIFKKAKPDIVHFHYLGLLLKRAMAVSKKLDLPTIYTYHMSEEHLTQPFFLRPLRSYLAKKIVGFCNRVDHVISVSKNLAFQLTKKGICVPVQYISNPVIFSNNITEKQISKKTTFNIFYAGRLDPEKNIPFLLRAFKKLLISKPDAILKIAGKGSQLNNLEKLTHELGLENKVNFLGFLTHDQLSLHYVNCDVFVLPSIFETQGLVAMEAMWFSKPIIVTNKIISADELVDQGVNGYIVDANSSDELASRLKTLAFDSELCISMGKAGLQKAKDYQPEYVIDELEEVYHRVNLNHVKAKNKVEHKINEYFPIQTKSFSN